VSAAARRTVARGAGTRPVERIAVRCPNWLGDVVMSTPALHALRRARPEARVTALVSDSLVPILEGAGLVDEVWGLASRGPEAGLRAWSEDRRRIARANFDLALVMPESVSSAWLMRAAGVRRVVGFARDPLRKALLHEVVPAPSTWGRRRLVSRERFCTTLVDAVFGSPDRPQTDLRLHLGVTPQEVERLDEALVDAGSSPSAFATAPPVVLAPGASFGETKCWPVESFAALGDRLVAGGDPVVLIGAPGEEARVAAVETAMRAPAIVLAGRLDLGALKALLRGAKALVANDAGARHVAAAFGVPGVVFFGPTSVEKTADNLASIEVLETQHACRPCYARTCPIDHRCLRTISVETALAATTRAAARADA